MSQLSFDFSPPKPAPVAKPIEELPATDILVPAVDVAGMLGKALLGDIHALCAKFRALPVDDDYVLLNDQQHAAYLDLAQRIAARSSAAVHLGIVNMAMQAHIRVYVYHQSEGHWFCLQPTVRDRMLAFARHLERAARHAGEKPAPAGRLEFGQAARRYHHDNDSFMSLYSLDGEHAGSIIERPDGRLEIHVNAGVRLAGAGSGASHSVIIKTDQGDYALAEELLADAFREAKADPTLIWSWKCTPENVRRAKAKGWWKGRPEDLELCDGEVV